MAAITREFTFLTAAFPHGAYQSLGANKPDLRGASIKGELRWWYDAIFNNRTAEDQLFGGLKNPMQGTKAAPESSRVIVRVQGLTEVKIDKTQFMPHKGNRGGEKNAILPGTRYRVSLLPRREGITPDELLKLERVLDAWLLLGSIGQRANRGAGSIVSSKAPKTVDEYESLASQLLIGTRLRAAVLSKKYDQNEKSLRYDAGDFLDAEAFINPAHRQQLDNLRKEKRYREADDFFAQKVGLLPFGSAKPRKPSLLKLRAAHLDGSLLLVALWDGRHQSDDTLRQGILQLSNHPKEIGKLLLKVTDKLCSA